MKTTIFSASVCLLILLNASAASAQIARFVGQWENVKAYSRQNSGIEVTREGDKVAVHQINNITGRDFRTWLLTPFNPNNHPSNKPLLVSPKFYATKLSFT